MYKNLTRIFCLILALLLSVAVFSGCKKPAGDDTSSTDDVTSIAPPIVEVVEDDGYTVLDGTDIVIVVKDNTTGETTMKVATDTTLGTFKTMVTANEGYSFKIVDAEGVEVTDDAAIIVNGSKFMLYKDGAATAEVTYNISVVTKAEIASTISEVQAEQSRYESQIAEASKNSTPGNTSSGASISGPGGVSEGRSQVGITSSGATSEIVVDSPLKGYTFDYATHVPISNVTEENTLLKDQMRSIEAKYGMTFNAYQDAGVLTPATIANAVMSGNKYADAVYTTINVARSLAKQGVICDLKESTTLQLNKPYFSKGVTDALTFQGKLYGVSFTSMGTNPMGVTFNKEMVSLYAPEYNIYDMYKNGTWTADVYADLMAKCSKNLDSNPNTYEIYGMTSNTNVIGIALSSFAGGTATKNAAGHVYPCFTTDDGIQSLVWCKNAFDNNYWKYHADIYQAINYFAAGSAATVVTYMWAMTYASSSADFDIGFVPFPKGAGQKNYITQTYDGNVYIVTTTNHANLDKVGIVLNELAATNDQLVNLRASQYENAGLDEIGCSVYRWALTNTTPDLSGGVYSAAIDTAISNAVMKASTEPASAMDGIAGLAKSETDDYYGVLTGQGQ